MLGDSSKRNGHILLSVYLVKFHNLIFIMSSNPIQIAEFIFHGWVNLDSLNKFIDIEIFGNLRRLMFYSLGDYRLFDPLLDFAHHTHTDILNLIVSNKTQIL